MNAHINRSEELDDIATITLFDQLPDGQMPNLGIGSVSYHAVINESTTGPRGDGSKACISHGS
jgi:hypothetical protein